jgi:ABC-type hemin transport system substrate-binding protein
MIGAAAAIAGACERGGVTQAPAQGDGGPRIVSLSPALSRTLLDFDLGERIVGRSAFCSMLPQEIPVVGDLFEIDYERLIRVQPTHVLIQPPSSRGIHPRLLSLAEDHGWTLGQWTINSVDDIEGVIRELPAVLYADRPEPLAAASRRAAELLNGIASALTARGDDLYRGRTMLVANTDPVLVFGPRTYLHDILTSMGGVNAVTATGWAELSVEDVLRLDPEAMIIVRGGGGPDPDPLQAAGPLATLDTTARRAGRIAVLSHPDANLPASSVIGVAEAMRRVLRALAETAP